MQVIQRASDPIAAIHAGESTPASSLHLGDSPRLKAEVAVGWHQAVNAQMRSSEVEMLDPGRDLRPRLLSVA